MKIKSVEIIGLNGSEYPINLEFNEDLNIITGRNGAGKTTVLKLIWYVVSSNFELLFDEINFISITCNIGQYTINLFKESRGYNFSDGKIIYPNDVEYGFSPIDFQNNSSSLFFSTFRQIEGGFDTNKIDYTYLRGLKRTSEMRSELDYALDFIRKNLSRDNHLFISSVGTKDINDLLIRKYSQIAESINNKKLHFSEDILQASENIDALKKIKQQAKDFSEYQQEKMKPFTELKKILLKFFKDKNVNLGDIETLSIGDTAKAISSNLLSAGEKQMLSFLVYNAFYQETIFIIDEPEISLHGDWQRMLVPTLMKQNSTNQFILATHSPFIYSKYPDKEIPLIADRGHNNG